MNNMSEAPQFVEIPDFLVGLSENHANIINNPHLLIFEDTVSEASWIITRPQEIYLGPRSKVYHGIAQNGLEVAVKTNFDSISGKPNNDQTLKEARDTRDARELSHNVGSLVRVIESNGIYYGIYNWIGEPYAINLEKMIQDCVCIPPLLSGKIAYQAATFAHVYAQRLNKLHRDQKPMNMLIDKSGFLKILDFGLATDIGTSVLTDDLIPGTPQYISPQLWQNGIATITSDIFALGVTCYQMLSGRLPFDGSLNKIQNQIINGHYPPLDNLVIQNILSIGGDPNHVNLVLKTALMKNNKRVYTDFMDFAHEYLDSLGLDPTKLDTVTPNPNIFLPNTSSNHYTDHISTAQHNRPNL